MGIIFVRKDRSFSEPMYKIKDLQKEIEKQRELDGENYWGAFESYNFNIDGKEFSLLSKVSYEEVWEASGLGKSPNFNKVFGREDKGPWEFRKNLRVISLATALNTGGDGKLRVGQNPGLQPRLLHDSVLHIWAQVISEFEVRDMKPSKLQELYDASKTFMKQSKGSFDPETTEIITKYIERELPNYKRRSFGDRLFKK